MEYGKDFTKDDLIVSLSSIQEFCIDHELIQNGRSFMELYSKTIEALKSYCIIANDRDIAELVKQFPELTEKYIDDMLWHERPLTRHKRFSLKDILSYVENGEGPERYEFGQSLNQTIDRMISILRNGRPV